MRPMRLPACASHVRRGGGSMRDHSPTGARARGVCARGQAPILPIALLLLDASEPSATGMAPGALSRGVGDVCKAPHDLLRGAA
eukprot:CAMPEP_0183816804 /NCGR_PEP_ID=MMETSP0803_2-20130417/59319_1 /TAXON_ID=195967 /ORGANISM="Crustomastix stigmata, Strain CCMP3273" /LENGTH=83 /DNA_ID=CAMNT_0026061689 /DNA_START=186 /DNA_END=438 /DNA_ORIENTATION=-